ncbi:hypothetical protein H8B09_11415 [Paenibacillus sp. PR3]|uniref:Phosphatase n=1 Tax=Paenibacillus terricola TaxID=2763503 RepID=A0ABR8MXW9_9BACL|nr:hypothetical protein [Paenibacillus terricola]MBD3919364.1 hypothetical protein [Paenibacillus terricola]
MFLRQAVYLLSVLIGILFIGIGTLPALFAYPFSDGPNSGPSSMWDLILMIAYEQWMFMLPLGIILFLGPIISVIKQRRKS